MSEGIETSSRPFACDTEGPLPTMVGPTQKGSILSLLNASRHGARGVEISVTPLPSAFIV